MDIQTLKSYFSARKEFIVSSIFSLVEIESPSLDFAASEKVSNAVISYAENLGLKFEIERAISPEIGTHLIFHLNKNEGKPILLLGHTDTVHPIGSNKKNPTRIEDDKLFGCGVFDMKANICLLFEAIKALEENSEKKVPITILLSCDEEVGSETGREFVDRESLRAKYCYVMEPSADGKAKTGRKGTGFYSMYAKGIPAHAGLEPEKGANAILELSRHIPAITELTDAENGTTVNVCTFQGGSATNTIPEDADFSIDVRFTKTEEAERVDDALRSIISTDDRVKVELKGFINRPPLERNETVLELYAKAEQIAAEVGLQFGETQVGGASDGNFVAAHGTAVLDGLGLRGNGAHTLNEFIYIDDIVPRAVFLTKLLADY